MNSIIKTSKKSKKEYRVIGFNPPLFGTTGGRVIVAHKKKTYSCEAEKVYPTTQGFFKYAGKFKKTHREKKTPPAPSIQESKLF